ncbi:hypothetical protein [Thermococcus sp.]|uniref:hypothetical protein n=1 Tax=Thermococcus sp. TaxID=35749 RepID=UPI001992A7DF|nr:hypothetical protein [Thermococcus sp.]MBC7095436.1 hypothetical protein [Thermococcus sp.]
MKTSTYYRALKLLDNWISKNDWAGYDPYDLLGTIPFIVLQKNTVTKFIAMKIAGRFPIILRRVFRIKKTINPKAMGLFARGYLLLYTKTGNSEYLKKALYALEWLIKNPNKGYSGFCWGYPFDWQSRVFIPKYTPSGVVTSVVAHAFIDAYEVLGEKKYLEIAKSTAKFFMNDLNVDHIDDETICFSYTPLDRFHVHNANLWVASVLARLWKYWKEDTLLDFALKAVNYTVSDQNKDGSWYYWGPPDKRLYVIDNYHTGFVLETLNIIRKILGESFTYEQNLRKGLEYYIRNLFLPDGTPKMTPSSVYPIDIHSAAQGIITCSELSELNPSCKKLGEKIALWTIRNMQDPNEGYFYYRIYPNRIDRTPYIRWGQAWMLRALSYLV